MKFSTTSTALAAGLLASRVHGAVVERQASTISTISSTMWAMLNVTVGGRLRQGEPFARPCYTNYKGTTGTINAAECQSRVDNVGNGRYRLDVFGAAMSSHWESCPSESSYCRIDAINPSNPAPFTGQCGQGSIAPYYISIKQASDAQAAFLFAQMTGVGISIKNTGHDYSGRSIGKDTLALWTHNLQDIIRTKLFVADQCATSTATDAVTLGAGVHWEKAYKWAEAEGVTLLGGACPTVGGAGGWVQGGGHGALSNTFGLGADRVLQYKVVTPDGQLRIANKCQNTDLFWAMRGGGGGTWGVALETTYKLEPKLTMQVYNVTFVSNATPERIRAFQKVIIDNAIPLAEAGWGGYYQAYGMQFLNPKLNATAARTSIKPIIDFMAGLGVPIEGGPNDVYTIPSFFPFENDAVRPYVDHGAGYIQSPLGRFIHKANFATAQDRAALLEAMLKVFERTTVAIIQQATPYSFKAESGATSVHPGWRTAVWNIAAYSIVPQWDVDSAGLKAQYQKDVETMDILRAITPFADAGVYLSESNVLEPNWQQAYFGSNYAKLLQIKQKYDPKGILDCWRCVGWKGETAPRFKCYA